MQWMLLPLRRYARFSGRSRPREYWMFVLFLLVGCLAAGLIENLLGLSAADHWAYRTGSSFDAGYATRGGPLTGLFGLAMLIPWLAVAVRRLHDGGRSGLWLLILFIPVIGGVVLLVFFIMSGTRGPNRFGPDPVEVGEPEPARG